MYKGVSVATCLLLLGHQALSETQAENNVDCGPKGSYLVAANAAPALQDFEKLRQILGAISNVADACPNNNFAQYYASRLWHVGMETQIRGRAPIEQSWASWQRAYAYSEAYFAMPREDRFRKASVPDSHQQLELDASAISDLRESLIKRGLEFGFKAEKPNELLMTDAATDCPASVSTDINAMRGWANENAEFAVQIASIAARYETACRAVTDPIIKYGLRLYFARLALIRLIAAEQVVSSDPKLAREFIQKVKEHRDSVIDADGVSITDWNEYSTGSRLAELESQLPAIRSIPTASSDPLVSSGRIPVESWFSGEHPRIAVMEAIGATMDSYVAETGPAGFIRVVGKAYQLFDGKPEQIKARELLYSAAHAYAAKKAYRSSDTINLTIPQIGYDWLKNPPEDDEG
ncbi:MAG: hypothetical protein CMK07_11380 [Ponticaulis sp.]|nr:hypothetical protein [Ponticaulis sp.]